MSFPRKKLVLVIVALAGVFCFGAAAAKSYRVPDMQIRIDAGQSGDMNVEERITYAFNGSFSFAFREIPLKPGESLSGVSVRDGNRVLTESAGGTPGTFSRTASNNTIRITWHFKASDETRTFTLRYTLSGVIRRYADAAVLYYKFVGEDWDRAIGNVTVRVYPPDGASVGDVRAWAHGPLNGRVDIKAGGAVQFDVRPLPARTFWEGRILYPPDLFPGIAPQAAAIRERIFEEERRWVEEANQRRKARQRYLEERAANRERRQEIAGRLGPVAWLAGLAGLVLWFTFYRRYGMHHSVTPHTARGEIPSQHPPAILSYLVHSKSVGPPAIVATLLDLAERGYLEIEETTVEKRGWFGKVRSETDYRFFAGQKPIAELLAFEKELLDFLFNRAGTGTEFTLAGVKKTAMKNRSAFRSWFRKWVREVKEYGKSFNFYEPVPVGAILINVFVGVAIMVGGIVLSVMTATPSGFPAIFMGMIQAFLSILLQRRTPEGRRLAVEWQMFRSHLKQISKSLGPVTLSSSDWSRYLAVAILFGMHKKLLPRIQMLDESGAAVWPIWYHGALGSTAGDFSAFADGFSGMVSTMSSTMSSASGTGGGASGGGGGGSGGGGGGAG